MKDTDVSKIMAAENQLTAALKSLFAVSEAYPELKANEGFMALQEEINSTENRIAFARQFYNDSVEQYNNNIAIFPNVLIAGYLVFKPEEFFAGSKEDEKAPEVKFSKN